MDNFFPTNTLASASFDVLKLDGVEDPLIDVNKLATLDFEECYFAAAVNFINECNNEYIESKKILYKSIAEAQTSVVVLESFSDFFVKVKEIIDKFLKFIKSLFQRFLTTLNRLIDSETYLKKHKKDLDEFRSADTFEFEGFNYTFSESIPSPEAALQFNSSLFDGLYGDDKHTITKNEIIAAKKDMNLEDICAQFRGTVIGKTNKIYMSEFADELFEVYRDGCSSTETIEADSSYVRLASQRFFNYKKTKTNIDHTYKRVEDAYKRLQSDVQEIVKRNGDLNAKAFISRLPDAAGITSIDDKSISDTGFNMSADFMAQMDIYVKAKVDQIQEYSNIHALAFAAKLDALKECSRQDRNTLYIALSRIQRTDSKRKD